MKKILITGGNGYIAQSLFKNLIEYDVVSITRQNFDLTNRKTTDEWFSDKHFDVVIHTAVKGGNRLTRDQDGSEIFYQNLQMFYNLYYNKHKFDKLIHFGSGAEKGNPSDSYGLSKKIIYDLTKNITNFYNIRIFAVFDENELERRFIKANIKRYINKEPIIIHQNKYMDFFYMKDLISLVKYYIDNSSPPKMIECSYREKYTLFKIANIINNLNDYKVPIKVLDSTKGSDYIGNTTPNLKLIGLEQGIKHIYNKLQ